MNIAATPHEVWQIVSDVTRVGEWSGECRGCVWMDGSGCAVPGARFRGRNRRGGFRWTRINEVLRAEPGETLVWRTLRRFPYLDSTEWRIRLTPSPTGTSITESFRILQLSKAMEGLLWLVMPAHRDRRSDLADDLGRLKMLVESGVGAG